MNNNTILAIVFLIVGTLLTSIVTMVPVPAAYAGGDDDHDDKKYKKGDEGNKQKVEDESAGAIADCDKNEVEGEDAFDCIAAAASENQGNFTSSGLSTSVD
jgi:hypothetical protein